MTVLFDLDGTLLDTAADFTHAANQLLAEYQQKPISKLELQSAISHGVSEMIRVCFKLEPSAADYQPLIKKLLALYEGYNGLYTQPFPGIMNLLETLDHHHILWGIVTNKPGYLTEALLESTGLKTRAACIVSGDTTPYSKPHPEPLLFACRQMGVAPEHCIYIGDAERDIQAGKAAGMRTLGVLFGYIPDIPTALAWSADDYVKHADEILPKILAWRTGRHMA